MVKKNSAEIGIIGGSGFYQFLKGKEFSINTPYGKPSDRILVGEFWGRKFAFLPRHGKKHNLPPHQIPYRANIYAFFKLGIKRIIAPCAVGSLKPEIKPGDFLLADDFIDFTRQRKNTFYDGKSGKISKRVFHISAVNAFCPELRNLAIKTSLKLNLPLRKKGKILVIEGPRFSTISESNFFRKLADVINMTALPEITLAKELGMCYLNISLVTDYDVGLKREKNVKPVTAKMVLKMFKKNSEKLKELILEILKGLSSEKNCRCSDVLKEAEV